ncbi:MAG: hypothetical protein HWE33_09835 [Rhodobacteraceae bacterium]|uniref:TadE/TadG family type IV pilus assembly protein n=1 Tax=Celeribacter sp. HF31 TaxID=2721558 RepID=UPI001431D1B6|nr:hypothetical protein [Celeribacter sp. HF31]NIY78223.1 hypothetical protein [Celeribacter sp. HF31]NVK46589.1 hypothetical protein [Paracoccaceae bacterium]
MTLPNPKQILRKLTKAFHRDEAGSMSLEAMFMAPFLIFLLMFIYTFFAAFEAKTKANKANYTISDYISRQTDTIDANFLDGLGELYKFLNNEGDISMRVSAVQFVIDEDENEYYEMVWSYGIGDYSALSGDGVSVLEPRLPLMADGEEVVVVETLRPWMPLFRVGMAEMEFADIVTTKPRFASQVVFDDGSTEVNDAEHQDSDDSDVDASGNSTGTNTSGWYWWN